METQFNIFNLHKPLRIKFDRSQFVLYGLNNKLLNLLKLFLMNENQKLQTDHRNKFIG